MGAGEKFADADLIGCGYKIIVLSKSLRSGGFEWVDESQKVTKIVDSEELLNFFKN